MPTRAEAQEVFRGAATELLEYSVRPQGDFPLLGPMPKANNSSIFAIGSHERVWRGCL